MTVEERLLDALDHIQRVADQGVKPTRRLAWISERALWAKKGWDWDARDQSRETPRNRVLELQKENAKLRERVKKLERR